MCRDPPSSRPQPGRTSCGVGWAGPGAGCKAEHAAWTGGAGAARDARGGKSGRGGASSCCSTTRRLPRAAAVAAAEPADGDVARSRLRPSSDSDVDAGMLLCSRLPPAFPHATRKRGRSGLERPCRGPGPNKQCRGPGPNKPCRGRARRGHAAFVFARTCDRDSSLPSRLNTVLASIVLRHACEAVGRR